MLEYLRKHFAHYIRINIVGYFFMLLIFIGGVVIGALAVKTLPEEQKAELVGYLQIFFQGFASWDSVAGASGELLGRVAANYVKTIGLMWALGFTIIGLPLIWFIVFTRGFIAGFTVGFLVNEYIMKGLAFALASVLPHSLFTVPAVIVTGVSATSFSLLLARRKAREKANLVYEALGYTVISFSMLLVMLIASVIEVYIAPLFMKVVVSLFFKAG